MAAFQVFLYGRFWNPRSPRSKNLCAPCLKKQRGRMLDVYRKAHPVANW